MNFNYCRKFLFLFICSSFCTTVFAQLQNTNINSINGYVFTSNRTSVSQIDVELLDDLNRSIRRTRTDGSGRFVFNSISAGRYKVRVLGVGRNFEDQIQDIEIVNIYRQTSNGIRVSSPEAVQTTFFLKSLNATITGAPETIFVQDVPKDAQDLFDDGVKQINSNNDKAIELFKKAIEIFPEYYLPLNYIGNQLIKQNKCSEALPFLERAALVNTRSQSSFYGIAYCKFNKNDLMGALESNKKSLELKPESFDSSFLMGLIYRSLKNYTESENFLLKANKLADEKSPDVHWNLALLYNYNIINYSKAASELESYLKLSPKSKDEENIRKLIKSLKELAQKNNNKNK